MPKGIYPRKPRGKYKTRDANNVVKLHGWANPNHPMHKPTLGSKGPASGDPNHGDLNFNSRREPDHPRPKLTNEEHARRAEEMRQILYEIATNPLEHGMVRLQAAEKLMDRVEGKSVQRNINKDQSNLEDWVLDSMGNPVQKKSDVA